MPQSISVTLPVSQAVYRVKRLLFEPFALAKAEVRVPWTQHARQAHSLFLFRLVLTLLALVFTFPTVIGFIIFLVPLLSSSGVAATIVAILAAIALGLLVIIFTCVWVIV